MQRFNAFRITRFSLSALLFLACTESKPAADTTVAVAADTAAAVAAPASLYDRLGGKGAITAVIDDFVGNVAADARINKRFAKTNIPHLKQMLVSGGQIANR